MLEQTLPGKDLASLDASARNLIKSLLDNTPAHTTSQGWATDLVKQS